MNGGGESGAGIPTNAIPAANVPQVIPVRDLCGGTGSVTTRRMPRSKQLAAMQRAGLRDGDPYSFGLYQQLCCRWGVTAVEGDLKDLEGKPLVCRRVPEGALGPIAPVEVYDAIAREDLDKVLAAIFGEPLSEEQRGN